MSYSNGLGPENSVRPASQRQEAASPPGKPAHGWVAKLVNGAEWIPGIGAAVVYTGLWVREFADRKKITKEEIDNSGYLKHIYTKPRWQAMVEIALPLIGKGITFTYSAYKSRTGEIPQDVDTVEERLSRVIHEVDEDGIDDLTGHYWDEIRENVERDASAIRDIGQYGMFSESDKAPLMDILKTALRKDGLALEHISEKHLSRWKLTRADYQELALVAIEQNKAAFRRVKPELCENYEQLKQMAYRPVDWEQTARAVEQNARTIRRIGADGLISAAGKKKLVKILKDSVHRNGLTLQHIITDHCDNWGLKPITYRDIALLAVQNDGDALHYLTAEKCERWGLTPEDYQTIALAAIEQKTEAVQYVRKEFLENVLLMANRIASPVQSPRQQVSTDIVE